MALRFLLKSLIVLLMVLSQQAFAAGDSGTTPSAPGHNQNSHQQDSLKGIVRYHSVSAEIESRLDTDPDFDLVHDFTLPVKGYVQAYPLPKAQFCFQPTVSSRFRVAGWKESNALYVHLNAHV